MRPLLFTILMLVCSSRCVSQYADQGSGNWSRHIWWLNWAGFIVQNGASKTFTTNNGLKIKVTFEHISTETPIPWVMATWPGSLLRLLYNFADPDMKPALYQPHSSTNYFYS